MITCYFGVPGCGKTTLATMIAQKELRKIARGLSKHKKVYTNFECHGCHKITFQDLDDKYVRDGLIVFDELMLDADNRSFKSFKVGIRDFLTLARHVNVDIVYVTQAYDKVDAKIRALTFDLWYVSKTIIPFFREFTLCRRIYRKITINEFTGDLVMGYRFANFLEKLFAINLRLIIRRRWYKYFDSFEDNVLCKRPVLTDVLWAEPFDPSTLDEVIGKAVNFGKSAVRGVKFNLGAN